MASPLSWVDLQLASMRFSIRKLRAACASVLPYLLTFLFYLLLLYLKATKDLANGEIESKVEHFIAREAANFVSSLPSPKQHSNVPILQKMLNCGKETHRQFREEDTAGCANLGSLYDLVHNASTRICKHLAGKRIVFVGPLTTYHLHTLWLDTLEKHEGHSLYCPGAEHCIFHHICIPGRNESSYLDGRKQVFPNNKELRETRSAVLQYVLSSSLVAHPDKADHIYTRPVVDPRTGIRMRNYYWLRKAQKATVLVLGQGPISAPPSTYDRFLQTSRKGPVERALFNPWRSLYLKEDLVSSALNATLSVFLPNLREALYALQADPEIRDTLVVWHGHWALDSTCTNFNLPEHVPRVPQFWMSAKVAVDPWTFYYNLQVHIHDLLLPKVLPYFNVLYLPVRSPPGEHSLLDITDEYNRRPRKDCLRHNGKVLEATFFSTFFNLLDVWNKLALSP